MFWQLFTMYSFDNFWHFWTIFDNFDNFDNFYIFDNFWHLLQFLIVLTFLFPQLLQFLAILTTPDNFVNCWQFFTILTILEFFRKCWNFLTILDNLDNWDNWDNFWQLKGQSWRLVTFETLITILKTENLNSWQSLLPDNYEWHWTAFTILAMFKISGLSHFWGNYVFKKSWPIGWRFCRVFSNQSIRTCDLGKLFESKSLDKESDFSL